jgi:von Willebrand factor A domain-containing protein 3
MNIIFRKIRNKKDPRQILSQIHLNSRMPIHTISFNCNDSEANKFLSQLARETSGRYHYFNESGWDADPDGPIPYQVKFVLKNIRIYL